MALAELLAAVEGGSGTALLTADAMAAWGDDAVAILRKAALLRPAAHAHSVECHGCEERCFMDVTKLTNPQGVMRAFVVCEVPYKQAEMGRVPVELARLEQWQCSLSALANVLVSHLGLDMPCDAQTKGGGLRLGMLPGRHGRRWLTLHAAPLALEIQQRRIPLGECLFVEAGELAVDRARIQALVDAESVHVGKPYVASTDRREARKADTAAMQQDWRDAYVALRQQHPSKPKSWCATRIAAMDIAKGRDSETIRKQLP